jgi:hypothetical protein
MNRSNKRRYVLMFDFVPKPLIHRLDEICHNALGSQSFIFFYKRFAIIRALPVWFHHLMVATFSLIWKGYLPIQRKFSWATIKSGQIAPKY